jgi:WD40 repeat protein
LELAGFGQESASLLVILVSLIWPITWGADSALPRAVLASADSQEKNEPSGSRDKKRSVDQYGDGLPAGAVARMGTVRRSANNTSLGEVNALAISPDGKTLFTASEDRSLRVWDAGTGKELRRLQEPVHSSLAKKRGEFQAPEWNLALACSGAQLALGTTKGLYLWNLADSKPAPFKVDWVGFTPSLAYSSDGRMLATGSVAAALWDVPSGKKIRDIRSPEKRGFQILRFAPDGRILASESWDHVLRLSEAATGIELTKWKGPDGAVECLAFSPCGRLLVSTDSNQKIRIWEVATGQERFVLAGNHGSNGFVAFSPNGRLLAAGGADKTIHIFDAVAMEEIHQFRGHDGWITALAFFAGGDFLASGSQDATVLVWDVRPVAKRQAKSIELKKAELESYWQELAKGQGAETHLAIRSLVAASDQSVAYLQKVLAPAATAEYEKISQFLRDLNSQRFPVRERAIKELEISADMALPGLKALRKNPPSEEVRRRVAILLKKLEGVQPSPRTIRALRAVEVLEKIATKEARHHLGALSRGVPEARLTQDAKAALNRLAANSDSKR